MNAPPVPAETTLVAGEFAGNSSSSPSWFVSILFWTSLLLAATMYGAVALSPKLAEWLRAREQYARNAVQLVRLEDEVVYLERVAQALRQDPEFARRVAQTPPTPASDTVPASRGSTASRRPPVRRSNENLPVAPELRFGSVTPDASPRPPVVQPPFAGVVMRFASEAPLRRWLLTTSVLLVLFGFTFLNDSENGYVRHTARAIYAIGLFPLRRYWSLRTPTIVVADVPATPQSPAGSPPAN